MQRGGNIPMDKTQYPYVFQRIMQQTNSGENIPLIYKNNVPMHKK